MTDIYYTKERVDREFGLLEAWKVSEQNKQDVRKFMSKVNDEGIGIVQQLKYMESLRGFSNVCQKDYKDITTEDLDSFMHSMVDKSPKTKKLRFYAVKKFLDFLGRKELFAEYKFKFNGLKKTKLPEDIFSPEEIELLINACNKATNNNFLVMRNQATIGVLYESGARIGEFLSMKLRDLEFDDKGCIIRLNGKTGERRVRIMNYVSLLQNYISVHPNRYNKESLLWIKADQERLSYAEICKVLDRAKEKAGIQKKLHPHILRHSRATHLAKFLTEAELKIFFGWTGGSEMPSVYVHLSGMDVDNKILKSYGIESNGHQDPIIKPKICIKCNSVNSSTQEFCKNCGSPLDNTLVMQMAKLENVLIKFFKVIGEVVPEAKEEFKNIMKEEKLEL